MIKLFKDRYKVSLILAGFFFLSVLITTFYLYTFSYNLMFERKDYPALDSIYIWFAITFISGSISIWHVLTDKNEVIVYRERQLHNQAPERQQLHESAPVIASLEKVKTNINQARSEKDLLEIGIETICKLLEAGQGALYLIKQDKVGKKIILKSGYALSISENTIINHEIGEGLIGQVAAVGKTFYTADVPEGYINVISGLGSATPKYLLIVPIIKQDVVTGVLEIASFTSFTEEQIKFVEASAQIMAEKIS